MYLTTLFLPLLSFIAVTVTGRFIGPRGSVLITTGCVTMSFFLSIIIFFEVGLCGSDTYLTMGEWIKTDVFVVNWGFMFDSLTVTMCIVVTFVSSLVHLYSSEYMSHDPHLPRFMSYLSLFTFFMLMLISADNFLQMFLGWEGVGLCSYLLINFWFTRVQANKAAIKAMILNRIGDFCLIMGILAIFINYKSIDYATVAALTPFFTDKTFIFLTFKMNLLTLICTFIFLGAMGKSAQLGLHTWLPDAMEGPTPVSALIHAATMVTAGVFLIARCSFLFEYAAAVLNFMSIIGASTAFFASTVGLLQNDLKRVVAYSTCSQLGYMIFACGSSDYTAGIFHLSNHAFFKALLFLAAGSVIHAVNDEQDVRKMGGLKRFIPFTYSAVVIGSLALTGFPYLTGFYSKDLVLELSYGSHTSYTHYSYWLGTFGAFLTAFYSTRLLCLTFLVKPNGFKSVIAHSSETFEAMSIALSCLIIPSVFVGYLMKDLYVGVGSDFFRQAIYSDPNGAHLFDAEFAIFFFKVLPLLCSAAGGVFAYCMYTAQLGLWCLYWIKKNSLGQKVYSFLNKKWFFDKLYNEIFGQRFFSFSYSVSYKNIDRGAFEMIGPQGLASTALKGGYQIHGLKSSFLYHYTLIILSSITAFLVLSQLANITYLNLDFRLLPLMLSATFFVSLEETE